LLEHPERAPRTAALLAHWSTLEHHRHSLDGTT